MAFIEQIIKRIFFHKIYKAIVENIIELKPMLSLDSSKQSLLQWLLKRIKVFFLPIVNLRCFFV